LAIGLQPDPQPLEVRPRQAVERGDRLRLKRKAGVGFGALDEGGDIAPEKLGNRLAIFRGLID
jgi:hypothetical protein